jgi:hypothetical protein
MSQPDVTSSRLIEATTDRVYSVLADYRNGHPKILPKKYFSDLTVESGGFGDGTIIRFHMNVLGQSHMLRASIMEVVPGFVLVENLLSAGHVTTFRLQPRAGGRHALVTIATELKTKRGLAGKVERFFLVRFLRKIYAEELRLLAVFVEHRLPAQEPAGIGKKVLV